MTEPSVVASRLTPPGQAGIAVVGVRGPEARRLVGRCFAPLGQARSGSTDRPLVGTFTDGTEPIDEVMVSVRPCGAADVVEVCCHGGTATVQGILDALAERGARVVDWQHYAARRAPDGPCRPTAQAALQALPWALTERAAGVLLDQMHGALDQALAELRRLAHTQDRPGALQSVDRLLGTCAVGAHLTRPWRVTIVGRANVGKSTLLNALVGYQRVTVSETPGTTRDVVRQLAAVDGWPVELADTAGLGPVQDWVEQAGVERAHRRLRETELALVVLDRSEPLTPDDERVLALDFACPAIHVANKIDLPAAWSRDRVASAVDVSALDGQGLDALVGRMADELVPRAPAPGQAVVFEEHLAGALRRVRDALSRGAAHEAVGLISRL